MQTLWMKVDDGTPPGRAASQAAPPLAHVSLPMRVNELHGFTTRLLPDGVLLAVSAAGDHIFTSPDEVELLLEHPAFTMLRSAEPWLTDLFHTWARSNEQQERV